LNGAVNSDFIETALSFKSNPKTVAGLIFNGQYRFSESKVQIKVIASE